MFYNRVVCMTGRPLVSIALCTYNGAKFLPPLLQSIQNQAYSNTEIVILDDHSTDDTFKILTAFAKADIRVKLHRNKRNLGFLKNFEKAMRLCRGDLIAMCDQDDIWHPKKIELQVAAIGDNLVNYHDSEFISQDNEPLNKKMSDVVNFYSGDQPEVFLLKNCVSGHAILAKRELLNYALPLQGSFHDWWLAYVAANHGSINYIPQCLVQYRQHEESTTDLLAIKEKTREEMEAEQLKREIKWLEICAAYPRNKNPEFVKTLYRLFRDRMSSYFSFALARFMMAHASVLLYISNRSRESKLRSIKRLNWGIKARNLWYQFIKGDRRKVVQPAA